MSCFIAKRKNSQIYGLNGGRIAWNKLSSTSTISGTSGTNRIGLGLFATVRWTLPQRVLFFTFLLYVYVYFRTVFRTKFHITHKLTCQKGHRQLCGIQVAHIFAQVIVQHPGNEFTKHYCCCGSAGVEALSVPAQLFTNSRRSRLLKSGLFLFYSTVISPLQSPSKKHTALRLSGLSHPRQRTHNDHDADDDDEDTTHGFVDVR